MKKFEFTKKNVIFAAFVLVQTVIYIVYNIISATNPRDPIEVKYAGILLCLAVTAVMVYFNRDADSVIAVAAMLFTAISDLFILVLDKYFEVGLATFLVAHTLYFYRLYHGRVKKIWISAAVRAAVSGVLIGLCCGLFTPNLLVVEACVYLVMLVGNCIEALIMCNRGLKNILFSIGLMLFLGCDICVGLKHGSLLGVNLSQRVYDFVVYMIWVFYLPSQVLITTALIRKGACFGTLTENPCAVTDETEDGKKELNGGDGQEKEGG
ncbi:MAG: lysoplasmalogenase [Roseburia sp.]|nr:lysoplasmalogenase [Roseburia sp.]